MSALLITAPEAAKQLNVSVRTVYSWISSGRLPSVRLSPRCTRVPVAAVESLIRMFRRYPRAQIERIVTADRRLSERVAGGWRNLLGLDDAEARP